MNVEPAQQPITDDPDLAQALANNDDQNKENSSQSGLQFEETPISTDPSLPAPSADATESASTTNDFAAPTLAPPAAAPLTLPGALPDDLEGIKREALGELRPLVEKLNLPADEKFDIMLLIIRSTDDHSLLATAHEAAKAIEDETRRAQALLDVVKEIDYFASQQTAA